MSLSTPAREAAQPLLVRATASCTYCCRRRHPRPRDVEDEPQEIAHAVGERTAGRVRPRHGVAARGTLAIRRQIERVGAHVLRPMRDNANDAHVRVGRARRGVECEGEAGIRVDRSQDAIEGGVGGITALGLTVLHVGRDGAHRMALASASLAARRQCSSQQFLSYPCGLLNKTNLDASLTRSRRAVRAQDSYRGPSGRAGGIICVQREILGTVPAMEELIAEDGYIHENRDSWSWQRGLCVRDGRHDPRQRPRNCFDQPDP